MSVVLQHPQTDEQYLKFGSTIHLYKFFKVLCGINCFACFNTPMIRGEPHRDCIHVLFPS